MRTAVSCAVGCSSFWQLRGLFAQLVALNLDEANSRVDTRT
jgi:hypothetical protein